MKIRFCFGLTETEFLQKFGIRPNFKNSFVPYEAALTPLQTPKVGSFAPLFDRSALEAFRHNPTDASFAPPKDEFGLVTKVSKVSKVTKVTKLFKVTKVTKVIKVTKMTKVS